MPGSPGAGQSGRQATSPSRVVGAVRDPLWLTVAAIGLALLVVNCWRYESVVDDAYISFRYLDNWLAGEGLVFNAGERVEGYTNFLWIVLLAPLRAAGMAPEAAALTLSLASLGFLLWAVFRTASAVAGDRGAGWAALALAAGSAQLARWTVAGMETTCFAALLALAVERLSRAGRVTVGASALFGLATLTRPVGILHAAITFGAALLRRGSKVLGAPRGLASPLLVFAAVVGLHLLFRLAYYGEPLPNTFYAKLTGDLPGLLPGGLRYVGRFLASGGVILVVVAPLAILVRGERRWLVHTLLLQVALHTTYVVRVGGDYFPFSRFLVPIVPALAVLGGVGLGALQGRQRAGPPWLAPAATVLLVLAGAWLANGSSEERAFEAVERRRHDRELVAAWIGRNLPEDALLAINAAGLIPYRTGLPTIDMLGLNDSRIARAAAGEGSDGFAMVGHFKHDGRYVCQRAPDAVLTSGATLRPATSADEAVFQAALNTFPGDREFLRAPECAGRYLPRAEEVAPGRYLVVYLRTEPRAVDDAAASGSPATAREWFERGLRMMRVARLEEAIVAFTRSLELNPTGTPARLNRAFCYLDLGRYGEAAAAFEVLLRENPDEMNALYGLALARERLGRTPEAVALWRRYVEEAPDSPWKDRARERLDLLTP